MASGTFPEEYISPKEKEKEWYGLQYAKAMYYTNNRYGPQLFYDDSEFTALTEISQGRQSVDNIRKLFGHFRNAGGGDDGSGSLSYIDVQVLNLAPKYINRAVAKMQRIKYDITLSAIDPISVDQQRTLEQKVKAVYELRGWFNAMKLDPQAFFPDLNLAELPLHEDELLFQIYTNPKLQKVIDGELSIKLLHSINDFNQKMREIDWNTVVYGRAHLEIYFDQNGVPRPRVIPVNQYIGSFVENENYEHQQYAGYFDIITVSQFIKEASEHLPWDKIQEIIQTNALKNSTERSFYLDRADAKFDGLDYIPVLRFYFKSQDERKYVVRKNQYGNKIMMEKAYNYMPPEEKAERYGKNGDSRIIGNTYNSIYGGTWVIDSECVYDYGRKKYPQLNLVEATLPIISFAPSMKDGRVVSFTSQIIEPLFMINVAHNKIKQILARGWMGIQEIDFNQLENVAMGRGGTQWTPRQVYEFMRQSDILVKRGTTNKYDQSFGSAIESNTTGLTLADYFTTFTTYIQILEQMTGTTVAESVESKNRVAATAIKASEFAGDLDMEYLYNAHEKMYQKASHQLLLLMQQAKKDKVKIEGFVPALGKGNTQYFEVPDDLALCEYGIIIERQPTEQEWIGFYNDVSRALDAGLQGIPGGISIADSALLRELDNLKQARQIMAIRQQIYERKAMEAKIQDQQMAMEANNMSAQATAEAELNRIQVQKQADLEVEVLKGKIMQQLQNEKYEMEAEISNVTNMVKERISKQVSIDEIYKQAVKNIPDKTRASAAMITATKPEPPKAPAKAK
jgi:hypothetical protein